MAGFPDGVFPVQSYRRQEGALMLRKIKFIGTCGLAAIGLAAVAVPTGAVETVPAPAAAPAAADTMSSQTAAQHLSQAVQIRTVSYEDKPSPDPDSLAAFKTFLETTYPAAHQAMTRTEVDTHALLFTWPGSDPQAKPIIFLAHMDVVPAEEQGDIKWQHPAFSGLIADGRIYGRGSIDMKGQLVSLFEALETLAKAGFKPRRTIYVGLGSNEETDGRGAQAIAAWLRAHQVHAEFVLDEGPVVLDPFELTNKRAAFVGVAEKGYGTLVVTATDAGGHSAVPPFDPALVRLSKAVIAIDHMPIRTGFTDTDRQMLAAVAPDMPGTSKFAIDNLWLFGPLVKYRIDGIPAGRALLGTTLAPTMMLGATKENELPAQATAKINVRIHPRDTADGLLAEARGRVAGLKDVTVAWEGTPNPPTPYASTQSDAYRLLVKHIRDFAGADIPVAPVLVFGGTDSRYYADLVDDTYRFQPYVLTEAEAGTIHGHDEYLSEQNLSGAIRFFHGFIQDAAQ